MSGQVDEAWAELIVTLRGDLAMTLDRNVARGVEEADAIIALGFLIGQRAARLPNCPPLFAVLSSVTTAAQAGHREETARVARERRAEAEAQARETY